MSKITESRKKILSIITSHFASPRDRHIAAAHEVMDEIKELILNDENWNEPKEKIADEDRSLLDVIIDVLPDEETG